MNNPSLHQESRYEPATVIPLKQEISLIDWLKANNRLIPRESHEIPEVVATGGELDTEELDGFIDGDDDDDFDDDFDDDADD
ncbi:MAG: DUF3134 domain-containing protein [Xenococcaceae cyanobacterium]